ncbi:MAG: hotdog fold thioesterase [Desulforhabdus sp.]|jgi:acyl-CoA thioesterase|nr:hotdog fold thioesterase [Desulforhabdus sp.]
MDETMKQAIFSQVASEPFAQKFGIKLVELKAGYSRVEMSFTPDMKNIFGMAHGGAIFALIDTAFETACNSHGTVAVALNVTVNYLAAASPGAKLIAEAQEVNLTRKTGNYDIRVKEESGQVIAVCQALAYRKGVPLPFIQASDS